MVISQARLDANRKNAQKSTGPRTAEGKRISRANAIKHGLCSTVVVPEDASDIRARAEQFFNTLKPQNNFHCWVVFEISLTTFQIDRCQRMERQARDKHALRAELCWDDDRRLEATLLGEQLGNRPEVVVDQLRRTLHGCEWMMGRWAMLARAADEQQTWTPAQVELAFDLLATPREFREARQPGLAIDYYGRLVGEPLTPADIARREVAALEQKRDLMAALDEANQVLAISGHNDEADPEIKRLHRHEARLQTHLRWCLAQLRYQSPLAEPLRGLKPAWIGQSEPPLKPVVLPEPIATPPPFPEENFNGPRLPRVDLPFDLEPDEFPLAEQTADIPKILASRKQKQWKKAEARREAKRRKARELLI